jgi:hypothetical protein
MMLKPDRYFEQIEYYFPTPNRRKARKEFRRAIRNYYVMKRKYVIDPSTGKRTAGVLHGEFIQQQKKQRRKVKKIFKGRKSAGRPKRPEVVYLVSKLFFIWGKFSHHPASHAWKPKEKSPAFHSIPTYFEEFLLDLLPKLGAPDVRRYVENHWKQRKVKIYVV